MAQTYNFMIEDEVISQKIYKIYTYMKIQIEIC